MSKIIYHYYVIKNKFLEQKLINEVKDDSIEIWHRIRIYI